MKNEETFDPLVCNSLFSGEPYYKDDYVAIYHGDCGRIMPFLGDFDLLLCDPPYGIGEGVKANKRATDGVKRPGGSPKFYESQDWDNKPVDDWIMALARARAEKQIIFGGNYYNLPETKCWLIWDKENGETDFADCEIAWTNLNKAVRRKLHRWNGMLRKGNEPRFHPTQKPLAVMAWALQQAGDVQTCLDPFMGSGTTLRACKDSGVKCVGIEKREEYCERAANRMLQEVLPFTKSTTASNAPHQPGLF